MQVSPNFRCASTISRTHHFPRYFIAVMLAALLQACGGGGAGQTSSGTNTVTGVAATGMAISGTVTLKDATGATVNATIAQPSGAFTIDIAELTPPYFLRATDTLATTTLYSIATGPGNFNINPLTNLAITAAAMSIDPSTKSPDAVFNNPAKFASLTPEQIQLAASRVMAKMSPAFQASLNANGASNANPLTDSFQVGSGLDKVFDNYSITLNNATSEVQETQVTNNITVTLGLVDELGTFPAAGVYNGTVNMAQSGGVHQVHDLLVTSSGEMRYVMDNGVQVIAHLTANGSAITGSGTAYGPTLHNGLPTNFKFPDGSTTIDIAINATLGSGTLSGTYTFGNYTDSFSFAQNIAQTTNAASLSKLAGTYVSSTESSDIFIGHIDTTGHIWGSGQGIAYSGLIQVIDPSTNLYRVTLAYLKDGIYGYDSGLATFYDLSSVPDSFQAPTALVPDGYMGDLATLAYSQATADSHGKFLMQLSAPLHQIFVSVVRMSTQQQTIVLQPSAGSLMIQVSGNLSSSTTIAGDGQLSFSGETATVTGNLVSTAGIFNFIVNPGSVILNGANSIAVQSPAPSSSGISGTVCSQSPISATPPAGTLIITANSACKVYDDLAYSGGNGVSFNGFLNGDTPAVLNGTLTYSGTSQGAINAGTYTLTPGGLTSSSYRIIYVSSTLTVTPLLNTNINNTYINGGSSVTTGGLVGDLTGLTASDSAGAASSVGSLSGYSSGNLTITSSATLYSAGNYSVGSLSGYSLGSLTLTYTSATLPTSNTPQGATISCCQQ